MHFISWLNQLSENGAKVRNVPIKKVKKGPRVSVPDTSSESDEGTSSYTTPSAQKQHGIDIEELEDETRPEQDRQVLNTQWVFHVVVMSYIKKLFCGLLCLSLGCWISNDASYYHVLTENRTSKDYLFSRSI